MPTLFTHAAVPLMLGVAAGPRRVSGRLLAAGGIAAMLADTDVIAFRLGIPYASAFGHRGALHSVAFALMLGLLAALGHQQLHSSPWRSLGFVGLAALSHPLLDACTDGGLGVALWWPFSDQRWFAPFRPIAVSPIGRRFFSTQGWTVMTSELLWVWLPTAMLALAIACRRRSPTSR